MKNRGNGRWPPRRALDEATRQHFRHDGATSAGPASEVVAGSCLSSHELRQIVAAAIG